MSYPAALDSFVNPSSSDFLNSPNHVQQHSNVNDAVEALEAKLGISASTPAAGKLLRGTGAGSSEWDKDAPTGAIVGTTDSQTLTNKTLTSPTINTAIINNPTLATDVISEYTAASGVTIDGLLIKDSKLATNNSVVTANITDDSVTDDKLDYPRWYQEIGRTTLSSAGDTITVSGLPANKYLIIIVNVLATGGTVNTLLKFNNDSGANYAYRRSINGAADSTTTAATAFNDSFTTAVQGQLFVYMTNISNQEKTGTLTQWNIAAAGAATAPQRLEGVSKWANTSAQINRVDCTNAGTGDFAIGSEVIVLGHN